MKGEFFLLLTTGFLTGMSHCVGMCGPLVSAFVVRRRAVQQEVSSPLVLFQTGRLFTYALLGIVMGAVGSIVNIAAMIRGWQGLFSVGLGIILVVIGLGLPGWLPSRGWLESASLARMVSGWMRRLVASEHPAAPFVLGSANGLLPCGAVYAMSLLAAATGNPLRGAMVMLVFGLGTLPAMLGIGLSVSMLSLRLRSSLFQLSAVLVVLLGLQLSLRGLALNNAIPHLAISGVMLW